MSLLQSSLHLFALLLAWNEEGSTLARRCSLSSQVHGMVLPLLMVFDEDVDNLNAVSLTAQVQPRHVGAELFVETCGGQQPEMQEVRGMKSFANCPHQIHPFIRGVCFIEEKVDIASFFVALEYQLVQTQQRCPGGVDGDDFFPGGNLVFPLSLVKGH